VIDASPKRPSAKSSVPVSSFARSIAIVPASSAPLFRSFVAPASALPSMPSGPPGDVSAWPPPKSVEKKIVLKLLRSTSRSSAARKMSSFAVWYSRLRADLQRVGERHDIGAGPLPRRLGLLGRELAVGVSLLGPVLDRLELVRAERLGTGDREPLGEEELPAERLGGPVDGERLGAAVDLALLLPDDRRGAPVRLLAVSLRRQAARDRGEQKGGGGLGPSDGPRPVSAGEGAHVGKV
jgi:hypothetical protein